MWRSAAAAIGAVIVLLARCRAQDCAPALAWTSFPARAALMLHTDAAARLRMAGASPRLQESAAVEIARLILAEPTAEAAARARSEPVTRAFVRRWYAAVAGQAQAETRWGEALDWAERGLKLFPDSADLLRVVASIEEVLALQANAPASEDAGAVGRERRAHLERADQALRTAVAATPDRTDVRLRLGLVAWKLGDVPAAHAAGSGRPARPTGSPLRSARSSTP